MNGVMQSQSEHLDLFPRSRLFTGRGYPLSGVGF